MRCVGAFPVRRSRRPTRSKTRTKMKTVPTENEQCKKSRFFEKAALFFKKWLKKVRQCDTIIWKELKEKRSLQWQF